MKILYHYPLCAFSRQIRIALKEKSVEHESVIEYPWDRRNAILDLQLESDLPFLVEGNFVYNGWYAIIEHLERQGISLVGVSEKEKAEVRRLTILFNDLFFADVTKNIVYEKVVKRYMEHCSPDSSAIRRGNMSIKKYLQYIEWLSDHRNWLAGNNFSFADIVAASHISCVDFMGNIDWNQFAIAKEWYMRIKSRPSFRDILTDKIPNITPPDYYSKLDF